MHLSLSSANFKHYLRYFHPLSGAEDVCVQCPTCQRTAYQRCWLCLSPFCGRHIHFYQIGEIGRAVIFEDWLCDTCHEKARQIYQSAPSEADFLRSLAILHSA